MIELPKVFQRVLKTAVFTVSALAVLAACSGGGATNQLNVHYVLAPVDGGSCVLLDASGKTIAGPAKTKAGTAALDVPAVAGMAQLSCAGGSYTDEATGTTAIGIPLHSYIDLGQNNYTAVVTPLTELAFRVLAERDPGANYQKLSMAVASAFGLAGIDIDRQVPDDLSAKLLADSDAGRYGAVLAALSQLQQSGSAGTQATAVLDSLAAAMTTGGRFHDEHLRDAVTGAMENLTTNTRLQSQVADASLDILADIFENMQQQAVAVTIWYVDTDDSPTQAGLAGSTVISSAPSNIYIVGRNLHFGISVTLGNTACQLRDLRPVESFEMTGHDDELTAVCPARAAGTAELLIMDGTDVALRTSITVQDAVSPSVLRATLQARAARLQAGTGTANVSGLVTAVAPVIDLDPSKKFPMAGSLRYDVRNTFTVKGVVVELLDVDAKAAVLMETSTDKDGNYLFAGAPAGRKVIVRVKAQLLQSRLAGVTTGPEWNISVRDNTSKISPTEKAMYVLDSAPLLTVAGSNPVPLIAELGFDESGNVSPTDGSKRQSAAFSILSVVYSAVTKLQATDPNVSLPPLNIYWSSANTKVGAVEGDSVKVIVEKKEKGWIGTSHFSQPFNGNTLPGVFILGKADLDTDEFDQGVVGHEFGHYLQYALSYSDNPGDSHDRREFKDASLSFGEGYGTAVGGLLSGSAFYTDSSGPGQRYGSFTDLKQATAPGIRKGFYSEESVGYLMYKIGTENGFSAFWKAVSALKNVQHSATIFAFLDQFIRQNPSVSLTKDLLAENIRSTDPLGTLPAGSAPDPAINATVSKGANDLEVLYLTVPLDTASAPPKSETLVSRNSPTFCLNSNLYQFTAPDPDEPPKPLSNTLGMSRRFTFKSTFTGLLRLQPVYNSRGTRESEFNRQKVSFSVREETGKEVDILGYQDQKDTPSFINVTQGVMYSLKLSADPTSIFLGNRCGNSLKLWRVPAS